LKLLAASNADRIRVACAIASAFLAGILPFSLLGYEGWWTTKLLALGGAPFLLIALLVGTACAGSVTRHPWRWAIIAACLSILLSIAILYWLTRTTVGVLAVPSALLASLVFGLIVQRDTD
jgi:hypothetical protein